MDLFSKPLAFADREPRHLKETWNSAHESTPGGPKPPEGDQRIVP
jgi:hypothetical protein